MSQGRRLKRVQERAFQEFFAEMMRSPESIFQQVYQPALESYKRLTDLTAGLQREAALAAQQSALRNIQRQQAVTGQLGGPIGAFAQMQLGADTARILADLERQRQAQLANFEALSRVQAGETALQRQALARQANVDFRTMLVNRHAARKARSRNARFGRLQALGALGGGLLTAALMPGGFLSGGFSGGTSQPLPPGVSGPPSPSSVSGSFDVFRGASGLSPFGVGLPPGPFGRVFGG